MHAQADVRKLFKRLQMGNLLPIASIYILLQGNLSNLLEPHLIVLPQHIIDEGPAVLLSNLDVGLAVLHIPERLLKHRLWHPGYLHKGKTCDLLPQ